MAKKSLAYIKPRLADILTASRIIIALAILTLSWVGPQAYITMVILVGVGAVTDILDGRAARRYLGEGVKSRLGKYDLDVDIFFILCVVGYLTLSNIVISRIAGLAWVGLAITAAASFKRDTRVMLLIEVPSVIALLIISLIYNPTVFFWMIAPGLAAGIIINFKRLVYVIFHYWPSVFSR